MHNPKLVFKSRINRSQLPDKLVRVLTNLADYLYSGKYAWASAGRLAKEAGIKSIRRVRKFIAIIRELNLFSIRAVDKDELLEVLESIGVGVSTLQEVRRWRLDNKVNLYAPTDHWLWQADRPTEEQWQALYKQVQALLSDSQDETPETTEPFIDVQARQCSEEHPTRCSEEHPTRCSEEHPKRERQPEKQPESLSGESETLSSLEAESEGEGASPSSRMNVVAIHDYADVIALLQQVELQCTRRLQPSRLSYPWLAKAFLALKIPPDLITLDSLVAAVKHSCFDDLSGLSWGLILSNERFSNRLAGVLRQLAGKKKQPATPAPTADQSLAKEQLHAFMREVVERNLSTKVEITDLDTLHRLFQLLYLKGKVDQPRYYALLRACG